MILKWIFLSLILIASASQAIAATIRPIYYLNYPSSEGSNTLWTAISGITSVVDNLSSPNAARFNQAGSTYSLNANNAYFDVSSSSFNSYNIGTTNSEVIDLNGQTFTVNGTSGQTVNFFAKLINSELSTPSGGLSVSGGGSLTFDNVDEKYSPSMDIGTVSISNSTISIPTGVKFGIEGSSQRSYSSLSLQNATLLLDSNTEIGSNSNNISVPITLNGSNSLIKLSSAATSSITPYFSSNSDQTLNIDTNGGTLNIYGNKINSTAGNIFNLNVHDSVGTGTLNLYGWKTASVGGNDYINTNIAIVSGNVNLMFDPNEQSISNISMTGGSLTGNYYTNEVTISGDSVFSGTGHVVSITMSENSVITTPATSAGTYSIISDGDLTANTDNPHYYVNLNADGQYSQIKIGGNLNISNLNIDLLLEAGTYPSNSPVLFPIIKLNMGDLDAPITNPTWNSVGVTLDSGESATGNELQLSLSEDDSNLNLEIQFLQNLHVATTQTTAGSPSTPTPNLHPNLHLNPHHHFNLKLKKVYNRSKAYHLIKLEILLTLYLPAQKEHQYLII